MRPATARDRLHAAVVALALCSTSVSIVVAGQPEDGQAVGDEVQTSGQATGDRPAARSGTDTAEAIRSFTDMVAEAAREQERVAAALPSEAQECVAVVDASAVDETGADGSNLQPVDGHAGGDHTMRSGGVDSRAVDRRSVDPCADAEMAAAL